MKNICFSIPANATDSFFSQVAMFRRALDALGGIYKRAHILLTLGGEEFLPLPSRWKKYLGKAVKTHWADPGRYRQIGYRATAQARWTYDYDIYDVIVFCDADTLLVRPIDDLLIHFLQSPKAMGVIAHYPFPMDAGADNREIWAGLAQRFIGKPLAFNYRYTLSQNRSRDAQTPFYVNYGFVVLSPEMVATMRKTYLSFCSEIEPLIKNTDFSGQISLALSLLFHEIPSSALDMRFNFPNDPVADRLYPGEMDDIRVIHYLRTDKFDRKVIFSNQAEFSDFLSLNLDGSNKVFQDHVRKLTNGKYPFV